MLECLGTNLSHESTLESSFSRGGDRLEHSSDLPKITELGAGEAGPDPKHCLWPWNLPSPFSSVVLALASAPDAWWSSTAPTCLPFEKRRNSPSAHQGLMVVGAK